jgi:hypothetical protein
MATVGPVISDVMPGMCSAIGIGSLTSDRSNGELMTAPFRSDMSVRQPRTATHRKWRSSPEISGPDQK